MPAALYHFAPFRALRPRGRRARGRKRGPGTISVVRASPHAKIAGDGFLTFDPTPHTITRSLAQLTSEQQSSTRTGEAGIRSWAACD
eukprot:gene14189-5107_t